MAGADYWQCPICHKKALYDHSDGYSDPPDVEVLHTPCLAKVRVDAERRFDAAIAQRDMETKAVERVTAERDHALAKAEEAAGILADAEKLVLNTGDWEYQPSELQIAEWVLRYREWAGLLLPNVTEVVERRPRDLPEFVCPPTKPEES